MQRGGAQCAHPAALTHRCTVLALRPLQECRLLLPPLLCPALALDRSLYYFRVRVGSPAGPRVAATSGGPGPPHSS
jgi:hypothetical protein